MLLLVVIITLSLSLSATAQNASLDLIQNLPYLNYILPFKQYSGYLKANANGTWKFHYWLVESQKDPDNDPLILWLEGGPGCSSVGSFFEELGPFFSNRDGQSLYENVFSWNKAANVLFVESPLGTGFSYDSSNPSNIVGNDDLIANQNYMALADFFSNVHPKYKDRPFYITGESYAGVYLPTLALNLVNGINNASFPNKNFKGMAIGNGYMNEKHLTNSLILWSNYHARISTEDWAKIKKACNCTGDVDNCNFYPYLTTSNHLDCDSNNSTCGDLIVPLLTLPDYQDLYNYYQDCYDTNDTSKRYTKKRVPLPALKAYQDTAQKLDYDNTDNQFGFPCWNEDAAEIYLNKHKVQEALHISKDWQNSVKKWQDCSDAVYDNYNVTYIDTSDLFRYIIGNVTNATMPDFRILIYSGDTDIVCNYLGVAWHIRDLADSLGMHLLRSNSNGSLLEYVYFRIPQFTCLLHSVLMRHNNTVKSTKHKHWLYRGQIAGYGQRYNGNVPIDLLTVKGAGHIVANDRPGPALQMIVNFIRNNADYSTPTGIDLTPKTPFDETSTSTVTPTTSTVTTTTTTVTPITSTVIPTTSTVTSTTSTAITTTSTATTTTSTSSSINTAVAVTYLLLIAICSISLSTFNIFF